MPRLSSQAREKSFRTLSLLHIAASCAFVLNIFEQNSFVRFRCCSTCAAQISELVLLAHKHFKLFCGTTPARHLGGDPCRGKIQLHFNNQIFENIKVDLTHLS